MEKIYCGTGWKSKKYDMINIRVTLDDLKGHIEEYNGKKQVRLVVAARKTPGKSGDTHYVTVDTWKPDASKRNTSSAPTNPNLQEVKDIPPEDIPF